MKPSKIAEAVFLFEEIWPVPYWVPVWRYMRAELDKYYRSDSWREKLVEYFTAGGYVFGPTKPITKDFVPVDNAIACLEALWEEQ